ncbi:hypothetical protein BDB00DRAFT_756365 [Zychaea mexicana]|uniref:uncharacterized protein n=1 Tax=Zychaea mexicana TaxID=64656 RepID=UPI0022FEE1C7|nr:uncharacterized protein BDB00DRAFT_756365 [Zychaea mexicana]KAI9497661.1 hypothetical protein BDB00DRAFT_756365 [Zychaea mexicana]
MSDIPGEPLSTQSKAVSATSGALQSFQPLGRICEHVCGFHIYGHDMTRQVHAHHFCSHVNEDFRQCIIYDSPDADARLIGIEYIISEKLFDQLPVEEKRYWHSHDYEVRSGSLALPMPRLMPELGAKEGEKAALLDLQKTYGKTWHTWQVDRGDSLPLGPAQLMMALTADGQLSPKLAAERKQKEKIDLEVKREERKNFPDYAPRKEADAWLSGKACQVFPQEVDFKK